MGGLPTASIRPRSITGIVGPAVDDTWGEPLPTRARADAQRAASLGPAYRIVKLPLRPYDDFHEYFDGDGP